MDYYKYNFISPHKLYARVQEEMRSYFATGAVDTLLFPLWTEDCIKKFRRTFLPIKPYLLCIKDGKAKLPDDFKAIRAAWGTSSWMSSPFTNGSAVYYPAEYSLVTIFDGPVAEHSLEINVDTYTVTRKITQQQVYSYNCTHLLRAGNVNQECPLYSGGWGIYDIDGDCFITDFKEGETHIQYYSDGLDEDGYQMIPDDATMQDYIRKYLTYKLYQQIFNQTTDETFNQVREKMLMAKEDMLVAQTIADTESKSETLQKKIDKIKKSYNRLNKYRL